MSVSPVRLLDQPTHERPRERMESLGTQALSDAELVAIQLGSGTLGESATAMASRLLRDFDGVRGLARADIDELCRHAGVGRAKASRLVSAFALAARSQTDDHRTTIHSSSDIAAVAAPRIGRARTETVLLLILDGAHKVSRVLTLTTGGATSSLLPIRETLALALRHDAIAIALAHNHPSGSTTPSDEDVAVTKQIRAAAESVGLRFLDHVVVAGDQWRSISASS